MQNRPKRKSEGIESLRRHIVYGLLIQFILNTLGALAVIFLVGFGLMHLSEKVILAVIPETVAQTAAMFFYVTRHFFPARGAQNE